MEFMEEKISGFYKICILSTIIICISIFGSSVIGNYQASLITAALLGFLTIPVYFLGKEISTLRILNPIMNAAAIGFSIGSLYSYKNISLKLLDIIAPMVTLIVMFFLISAVLKWLENIKWFVIVNILLGIAAIILAISNWNTNIILYGQVLFLAIFYIFSFVSLQFLVKGKRDLWFALSVMYFSAFFVVFVIVLMIISESADGLEFFGDIFDFDFNRKNKKVRL